MYILYVLNSSLIHNIEIINVLYIYTYKKKSKKVRICMHIHPISIKKIFIHIHNSFLILLDYVYKTFIFFSPLLRVYVVPFVSNFSCFKLKTWKFLYTFRRSIVLFFEYFPSNSDFPGSYKNFPPSILDLGIGYQTIFVCILQSLRSEIQFGFAKY